MKSETPPPDWPITLKKASTNAEAEAAAMVVAVATREATEIEEQKPWLKTVMNTPALTVK
jgi:hypothetical protein